MTTIVCMDGTVIEDYDRNKALTRQEMFNRAFIGLRSQGFRRSLLPKPGGVCAYHGSQGRRCAWGWIDQNIPKEYNGKSVLTLREYGIGIARNLDSNDLYWATQLQNCHDNGETPSEMQIKLLDFAERHSLTIPE